MGGPASAALAVTELRRRKTFYAAAKPFHRGFPGRTEGLVLQKRPAGYRETGRAPSRHQIACLPRHKRPANAAACAWCCAHRWRQSARSLALSSTKNLPARADRRFLLGHRPGPDQSNPAAPILSVARAGGKEWHSARDG